MLESLLFFTNLIFSNNPKGNGKKFFLVSVKGNRVMQPSRFGGIIIYISVKVLTAEGTDLSRLSILKSSLSFACSQLI